MLVELQIWQLVMAQPMQVLLGESRVKLVRQAVQAPVNWLQPEVLQF